MTARAWSIMVMIVTALIYGFAAIGWSIMVNGIPS